MTPCGTLWLSSCSKELAGLSGAAQMPVDQCHLAAREDFLRGGHIRLRYNLITQRYEFLEIPEGASLSSDKPPRWQILLDRHVNSLWTKMSLTVKVNKLDMRNVILVYIGRQGANKTTWFNHLLPPELKQYFFPWVSMPATISHSDDG